MNKFEIKLITTLDYPIKINYTTNDNIAKKISSIRAKTQEFILNKVRSINSIKIQINYKS